MATGIEWTDETWNPTRGCTRVSEGCKHCYAERQAIRQSGPGGAYEGLVKSTSHGPQWTGEIRLAEDKLGEPLTWRKPRRVFVDSMSDLFHEGVPFEFVDRVFAVMALSPQHTFQILTKRPERMLAYATEDDAGALLHGRGCGGEVRRASGLALARLWCRGCKAEWVREGKRWVKV